jgi:hypothetical protein
LKTFEELLKLMPSGWEQKMRELGALKRSWEIRDAKDLFTKRGRDTTVNKLSKWKIKRSTD